MDELPDWMLDCIDSYHDIHGRLPTTFEFLMWKEAVASCRMEHE